MLFLYTYYIFSRPYSKRLQFILTLGGSGRTLRPFGGLWRCRAIGGPIATDPPSLSPPKGWSLRSCGSWMDACAQPQATRPAQIYRKLSECGVNDPEHMVVYPSNYPSALVLCPTTPLRPNDHLDHPARTLVVASLYPSLVIPQLTYHSWLWLKIQLLVSS